jgi:hypothetical protein
MIIPQKADTAPARPHPPSQFEKKNITYFLKYVYYLKLKKNAFYMKQFVSFWEFSLDILGASRLPPDLLHSTAPPPPVRNAWIPYWYL